jgi:hypothetical protein
VWTLRLPAAVSTPGLVQVEVAQRVIDLRDVPSARPDDEQKVEVSR